MSEVKVFSPEKIERGISFDIAQKVRRALEQPRRTRQSSVDNSIPKWPSKPFGTRFLKCGQVPPRIDAGITPGTTLRCVVGFIETPSNFYVMPYETYNELEYFQTRLNKYVEQTLDAIGVGVNKARPNSIADLLPGLYVYAKVEKILRKGPKLEWHRAKIIYNPLYCKKTVLDIRSKELMVRLVDFGDTRNVPLEHIRFMSNSFEMEFPIQGIRCEIGFLDEHYGLSMSELTSIPNLKWPDKSTENLIDLLENNFLAVTFLSCYLPERAYNDPFDPAPEVCWSVGLNIVVSDTTELPYGIDPVTIEPTLETHPDGDIGIAALKTRVSEQFKGDIDKLIVCYKIKID